MDFLLRDFHNVMLPKLTFPDFVLSRLKHGDEMSVNKTPKLIYKQLEKSIDEFAFKLIYEAIKIRLKQTAEVILHYVF